MSGRNRFTARGARLILEKAERYASGPCVFISHQFADATTAAEIGDQLKSLEIDIWLDTCDVASQEAAHSGDDAKLADAIEWGLTNCTHLLALITTKTRGSWWVPFEIGSVRRRSKPLVFFVHKDVTGLPGWLVLGRKLLDQIDFYNWATEISENRNLTESRAAVQKSSNRLSTLLPSVRTG